MRQYLARFAAQGQAWGGGEGIFQIPRYAGLQFHFLHFFAFHTFAVTLPTHFVSATALTRAIAWPRSVLKIFAGKVKVIRDGDRRSEREREISSSETDATVIGA